MKLSANDKNLISLQGVGDVPRPVDINESVTGFEYLKSLRIYRFSAGQVIEGEAEGDEVCIVFLSGSVGMEVIGPENHTWTIIGRSDPFNRAPYVVYLPPHYSYRLSPKEEAEVAYARSAARGDFSPYLMHPENIRSETQGNSQVRYLLPKAEHLICTETVGSGWSPYPPHKHDTQSDEEAKLEQLSYHLFEKPNGFALARIFNENKDEAFVLTNRDILAVKEGYHSLSIAPDQLLYRLNFWAGPGENAFRARTGS
ncbi:MAG: 5-deoxy-glucuronate isomerase [Trueperaceae bacterium]|nr:5-deoxy-glucuronate isomerase [Trueperaceae bacterium]